MSQNLYQDAIADARKLREMAEQSAKNKIIDAVTPRIRDLIESQLLGEDMHEAELPPCPRPGREHFRLHAKGLPVQRRQRQRSGRPRVGDPPVEPPGVATKRGVSSPPPPPPPYDDRVHRVVVFSSSS